MERPMLDACLIVKNEEANLPACLRSLESLSPILGSVCVYDTGSDDDTVAIAESFGAVVQRGSWDDDFARARNLSVAMSSAKWVLTLDADETVVVPSAARLESVLRQALTRDLVGVDGLKVAVADMRGGVEVQANDGPRLFRPSRARWEGRLHEHVVATRSGGTLTWGEPGRDVILVQHVGYGDPAKDSKRFERNLSLAHMAVEAARSRADDVALLHALVDRARTRHALGDRSGALEDACAAWAIKSAVTYRAFGGELLAQYLIETGDFGEAERVIQQLRHEGTSHPDYLKWLQAMSATAQGDTRRALELLRTIDVLASSLGLVVSPPKVIEDHLWAAVAEGEALEAASSLVSLMAGHGVVRRKFGELLVTLTADVALEGLASLIREADRGHLEAICVELNLSRSPAPELARLLSQPV